MPQWPRVSRASAAGVPLLAGRGDPPPQRVRPGAERGKQFLRQVSGLVADLPEALRAGQHADHRHGQHEHHTEPPAPALARVRNLYKHLQQAGHLLMSTRKSAAQGMRDWHGWPLVPGDRASGTLIIRPGGQHRATAPQPGKIPRPRRNVGQLLQPCRWPGITWPHA